MKNLIALSVALLFTFASNINAKVSSEALNYASNCNWQSWFEYPNKSHFNSGEDVYVRVKPKYKQHIKSMTLYVGNKMIRTESSYPYEWCKGSNGDNYLRHLQPGTYKLKVKIIDHCHKTNYIYKNITVKGGGGGNNGNCHFNNPCYDLHWLKQLKQKHPNWTICEYKKNGKIYFKLFQCGVSHYTTYWYDCHGNLICKGQNGNDCFSGCAYVKCWYTPCDNGNNNNNQCDWKTWFEYPKKTHFNKGSDVYVRVAPSKKYDIAYMKLYLDGHFVRTESSYPFEWCRKNSGGDYALRNMQHKGQHTIKVEIKDKCGKKHYQYYKFYIN